MSSPNISSANMSDDAQSLEYGGSSSVSADVLYTDLERILLKPLTESGVKYTFRGRKSLALFPSWDCIVYKNIRRVFQYKEFEKQWQHIDHNKSHLMEHISDYRKRRALRAQSRSESSRSKSHRYRSHGPSLKSQRHFRHRRSSSSGSHSISKISRHSAMPNTFRKGQMSTSGNSTVQEYGSGSDSGWKLGYSSNQRVHALSKSRSRSGMGRVSGSEAYDEHIRFHKVLNEINFR